MTPRQFHLLLDGHREKVKHEEWMTGVIAAAIANWSMGPPDKPMQPKNFALPLLQEEEHVPRLNRKKVASTVRNLMGEQMKKMREHGFTRPF